MLVAAAGIGCSRPSNQVVVYCALDREFSEPVLDRFERETGIDVLAKYDTESTKSVGLTQQLLREQSRPVCDVFWNNEILNTVRLAEAGALEAYASDVGRKYPAAFRSPQGFWYGFAARVRVLLVNTERVKPDESPATLEGLTLPKWRGQVGIAKPLFGTTATHAACLFSLLGPEEARGLFRRLKENDVQILAGNKQVAVDVGAGRLAMGLTDTDDSLAEIRAGRPVRMVYLDGGEQETGILMIPNTVSVIAGAPHAEQARRLVDFLLSPNVEAELAAGKSGQIPLHPQTRAKPELGLPDGAKHMPVDFAEAAQAWDEAMQFVKEEFTAP
jgi:iron(III) transport system substrate-binding protein